MPEWEKFPGGKQDKSIERIKTQRHIEFRIMLQSTFICAEGMGEAVMKDGWDKFGNFQWKVRMGGVGQG